MTFSFTKKQWQGIAFVIEHGSVSSGGHGVSQIAAGMAGRIRKDIGFTPSLGYAED